jgi:RimJ/RimL family protein N-acetyltransferase
VADDARCVELVGVDDTLLEQLVHVATTEAAADEVTPPLTAGSRWTPRRIAWLREFHVDRRGGLSALSAPAGEATWAVMVGGGTVGSVRLKGTDRDGVLETGIWLGRSARGRGIGRAAMTAVLAEASGAAASEVRAHTTLDKPRAVALLRHLGFELAALPDGVAIEARVVLGDAVAPFGQPPSG